MTEEERQHDSQTLGDLQADSAETLNCWIKIKKSYCCWRLAK